MKWIGALLLLLLASPAAATISSPQVRVVDAGNGSTTVFNYPFLIPFQANGITPAVAVQIMNNATGALATLAPSQYTISGVGNTNGGHVTYNPSSGPLPSGQSLVITRTLAYIQPNAVPNSTFYPHTVENVADNLDAQIQQLANGLGQTSFAPQIFNTLTANYGAVCDGVTNDTTAVQNAALGSLPVFIGNQTCLTTLANISLVGGNFWGQGRIETAGGDFTPPYWSIQAAPPASVGNWNSILTAFDGDLTHVNSAVGHIITGATTLGQPTSGYKYTEEAYGTVHFSYNDSGWNQGTSTNVGRTAAVDTRVHIYNHGQGDMVAFNATAFVDSVKPGATSWLASPAVSLFNGDQFAGNNGVYLNPYEILLNDQGFDVAAVGSVTNLVRSNGTGALGATWMGYRLQSQGSTQIDSAYSAAGPMKVMIDETPATLDGTSHAFMTTTCNARWYGNASAGTYFFSALNSDYIEDDCSLHGWNFIVNNTSVFQMVAGQVSSTQPFVTQGFFGLGQTTFAGLSSFDPTPSVGHMLVITDTPTCTANTAVTTGGSTGHSCPVVWVGSWKALVSN